MIRYRVSVTEYLLQIIHLKYPLVVRKQLLVDYTTSIFKLCNNKHVKYKLHNFHMLCIIQTSLFEKGFRLGLCLGLGFNYGYG